MEHVQRERAHLQWSLHLTQGVVVERSGSALRLSTISSTCPSPSATTTTAVAADVRIRKPQDWVVEVVRYDESSSSSGGGGDGIVLENIPPGASLVIRTRKEGDRFHPPWRETPQKMKDFLRGQKIPLHLRDQVPLICLEAGGIGHKEEEVVVAVYPSHINPIYSRTATPSPIPPLVIRIVQPDGLVPSKPPT